MRKHGLALELARKTGVSRAEAADQVDRLVNDILQKLKNGEPVQLPGFGEFSKDGVGQIKFSQESDH